MNKLYTKCLILLVCITSAITAVSCKDQSTGPTIEHTLKVTKAGDASGKATIKVGTLPYSEAQLSEGVEVIEGKEVTLELLDVPDSIDSNNISWSINSSSIPKNGKIVARDGLSAKIVMDRDKIVEIKIN